MCEKCQDNQATLRELTRMLRDPDVYDLAERPIRMPERSRIEDAQSVVRRAADERRLAAETFEELLALPQYLSTAPRK